MIGITMQSRRRLGAAPFVAAVALAALALVACSGGGWAGSAPGGGSSEPPTTSTAPAALAALAGGDALPEATLALLGSDERVATTSWQGQPTVVNFWATWCAFCVEEMPAIEQAHLALDGQVRFVGVDREDRVSDALAFVEEVGTTYLQVEDPDGAWFAAVQARGMPTTVFVDAAGVIQYRHAGPLTQERLLELVAEHLGVSA